MSPAVALDRPAGATGGPGAPERRRACVIGRGPALAWPALLLVGFSAAVLVRCAIGGVEVARSRPAGLAFAVVLLGLCLLGRVAPSTNPRPGEGLRGLARPLAIGAGGAVVLCAPALVHLALVEPSVGALARPTFLGWAAVVAVVATAEEAFLRGVLFTRLEAHGRVVAILVPAVAFAALHLPLYGWGAVPLDLAVGVWLGALRSVSGRWVASAAAHVLADWAAWWLV